MYGLPQRQSGGPSGRGAPRGGPRGGGPLNTGGRGMNRGRGGYNNRGGPPRQYNAPRNQMLCGRNDEDHQMDISNFFIMEGGVL